MINYIFALIIVFMIPAWVDASPGQSGSSGLLNVSTAETLDSGNICIGVWSCYGENKTFSQKSSMIMPVTLTLGIGTFWEIYGAYPNIFFNGDDDISGRGTLDLGTKLRFLGSRSSALKIAVDLLAQRHVSESRDIDGATDLSAKLVASYNKNDFGIHVTAGYLKAGSTKKTTLIPNSDSTLNSSYTKTTVNLEDELIFGTGVEYMLMPRLKILAELTAGTNRNYVEDTNLLGTEEMNRKAPNVISEYSVEASLGAQYYLNPHLTLNLSFGKGLGPNDSENKILFGISSCQGIGTYVKPIPSVGRRAAAKDKTKEALKPLKIIPISSLLLKASAPQSSPVSKLEVELEADKEEEVLIKPYGQIVVAPQQASSNLTSPVIPVEIPLKARDEEISLTPFNKNDLEASAIEYTLRRISGVTQLYRVDVKGPQKSLPPDIIPERMTVYRKFLLPDVIYDLGQWALSSHGKKMLSEVAEQIRKDKKWLYLKVDGHTDIIGSESYNMDLSLKRAIAAATYLISHEGVDPAKVFIEGRGQASPLAENNNPEGRRANRRTEVLFLISKEKQ